MLLSGAFLDRDEALRELPQATKELPDQGLIGPAGAAARMQLMILRPQTYPSVDVFLPVCGEPVDVVRNTWKYVAEMSQHYQGTVTAYVLDDSASPELKAMAREFGFAYARRPNRGWFKKSGNLWFGFQVLTATTSCCWTPTSHPAMTC